jgi:hypothetical protein
MVVMTAVMAVIALGLGYGQEERKDVIGRKDGSCLKEDRKGR